MKLEVAVNETVLSNVNSTGEFKIRNSAKAFKILSDGLYSNKIKAIIRELSCNAVDSHIAAGKADVPFEVHFPTMLEPWFSVRDYGTGLDGNQVENIYTTYFESTKTDSNDFIGALGLGSKSPFSYTENFTVTAIKDGTKRIYSAFINENGVPSIAEMSKALTDEPNGVEVKFSVTDRYDYNSFRHEGENVFRWFKLRPTILGIDNWKITEINYKEKDIVPGVHYQADAYKTTAVMGNIAYPINISEPQKHFKELAALLECGLVIEFPIGALDFAASREELSYVPLTIKSIKEKLEELNANLMIHLKTKADAITNEWERAAFLVEEYHTKLYKAAVVKYVNDSKFELFDLKAYRGQHEFNFKVVDIQARGMDIRAFRSSNGSSSMLKPHSKYENNNYVQYYTFPVEKNVVIVQNDLKTGCLTRARYHFANTPGIYGTAVYCISHSDPDLEVRQAEYDKLMAELHNPPTIIKASTLMKQVRQKPVSSQGIVQPRQRHDRRRRGDYCWDTFSDKLDDNTTYYYVAMNGSEAFDKKGNNIDMLGIRRMMNECGIEAISKLSFIGVRKSRIKELEELDNFVHFDDIMTKEIAKISDKQISSLVAAEMLDSYYNRTYTNATVAKLVGKDSDYAKYVDEFANMKRATGNVTQLVALCQLYGKAVTVDSVKKKFTDAREALHKKYPLLHYIHHADEKDIAEYIKMVDKQEKT